MSRSPAPSSYVARRTMQANRRSNTTPERRLGSALHALGLRYRKDRRVVAAGRRVRPDLVFGPTRVAVFVDGCFWHRCPEHATHPAANSEYWQDKFDRNLERDRGDDEALQASGWAVVRVWEHEDPAEAARRVEGVVRSRRALTSAPVRVPSSALGGQRARRDFWPAEE